MTVRPNPANYPAAKPFEIRGYACEVAGIPMVVHRSITSDGLGEPIAGTKFWTVTEPRTGMAAWEGDRAETTTRAEAIERAEMNVQTHGGAKSVEAEVERHALPETANA